MTKAEFTPVANALESNIDAALARIRELEARLDEQNIRANERVADALKDRADMLDRAVAAEARLEIVITLNDAMNERAIDLLEAYEEVVAGNQALLKRAEEAEAENARLRAALEMVEWIDYGGHESGNSCPWCHAMRKDGHALDCARQAALSPEQPE